MVETWDDQFEALRLSRGLYHNADYWEFLVRRVWQIDRSPVRVADFGCGYGRIALTLLPLLLKSSSYTGFDIGGHLVLRAREIFARLPYSAEFLEGDVHHAPLADDAYDVAISHTVLMHVPDPRRALREMIRVTRHGGLVITCDANRDAFSALLHIHEMNEQGRTPLELFQTINRHVRQTAGVDYNLGMKMPVLMHELGLKNVQVRISDAVRLLFPPVDTPQKEEMFQAMCSEGLGYHPTGECEIRRWCERLVAQGVSPEAASREIARELDLDFAHRGREYHTVWPGLLTFSFGIVDKS